MTMDTSYISERCQGAAWQDGRSGRADVDSRRLTASDEDEIRIAGAR